MDPFDELEQHYPEIIAQMGKRFNAHKFILVLAHKHQSLYIRALAQYSDKDAPFKIVHGRLAQALYNFDHLIDKAGDESSTDIFGHANNATVWVKR